MEPEYKQLHRTWQATCFSKMHMKLTMKINLIPIKKLAMLSAAFCAAMLAFSPNAKASTLNFADSNDLGFVGSGIPSGDQARTDYVNHLIAMTPGTNGSALSQTFERSLKVPGPGFPNYPTAVFDHNGTGVSVDLGDGTLYSYLFAKYDGPNAGSEVWYVGGMSGIITIPATGIPGHGRGQYGLSGWTLFGPGVPLQTPDGGTTVMLLGVALSTLGMARRFLKK